MTTALREVSEHLLPGLDQAGWEQFGRIFTHETTHYYDRYLAGELTFNEQRLLRGRAALGHFGVDLGDGEEADQWLSPYAIQPAYVKPFEDVVPLLDALDAAGIPYGAVSNNVHDYQRAKLDGAGPGRIRGLLVPTPWAWPSRTLRSTSRGSASWHSPADTLYVGDNRLLDAEGSTAAGLLGVWLNRAGEPGRAYAGSRSTSPQGLLD